jgi:division protein CdvB (Snf7/Vps24/ESCRT-III family)
VEKHTEDIGSAAMPSHPFEEFGRKVDEQINHVTPRVEEEVRKVISYLNDEVVPKVRQNSSEALRIAAEQLGKLAEDMERK